MADTVKIEKTYRPVAITEVLTIMAVFTLTINVFAYLILMLFTNTTFSVIFNKNWIPLLATPMVMGMVQALTNRNVILKISDFDNFPLLRKNLETLLVKEGYAKLPESKNPAAFELKTAGKIILRFGKNRVTVSLKEKDLEIKGKTWILDKIETKIRWNESFTSREITEP